MRLTANTILLAAISLLFVPAASAQLSLNDLPDAQGNSRFYDDSLEDPNGNSVVAVSHARRIRLRTRQWIGAETGPGESLQHLRPNS